MLSELNAAIVIAIALLPSTAILVRVWYVLRQRWRARHLAARALGSSIDETPPTPADETPVAKMA